MQDEENELASLRERIDNIDYLIHDLVNDRAKLALKIAQIKIKYHGEKANFHRPEREKLILQQIKNYNKGPLDEFAIERIFAMIIQECRELQTHTDGFSS
ncbi:MAG: chorismate mutase [Gammaproteobacteria bacterium RIFCSPHIGHO2_12_FULL_41_15]|nr:MAG: chorismate mutase [Gammaproteobacteria bacterium RIFCSPHIGHO2_12_FULL_41_15]